MTGSPHPWWILLAIAYAIFRVWAFWYDRQDPEHEREDRP